MTPREDWLTRLGATVLLAHFRGDTASRDRLVAHELDAATSSPVGSLPLADALTYAAVVGVTMLASIAGTSGDSVLAGLPHVEDRLIPPPAGLPWDDAVALVAAVPRTNSAAAAAAHRMDMPGAVNGAFAVGVSAFQQLQSRTRQPAVGLLQAVVDAPPQA